MGTEYSIKVVPPELLANTSGITQTALAQEIEQRLQDFNQRMSTYIDDSELSLLNQAEVGAWLPLSPMMAEVLQISHRVYEQSEGAFDITVGPLVNLWGFGPQARDTTPTEREINESREYVGMHHVALEHDLLRKNATVYMDLSAVAKGFATDVVARALEAHDLHNYMVEIGGELKIRGRNPRGQTWVIGIEKPTFGHSGAVQALTGDNIAIATSGDYRNYYEQDGKRISHTIDPVSGKPIDHTLVSVTVVTAEGGYADAYATALNVLGPERAKAMAARENLAVFFVVRAGESYQLSFTEPFEQYMVK